MKIKDLCTGERPREKMFANGAYSLSNGELLALLLGSGYKGCNALELALELLGIADGKLINLFNMSADKLKSIPGMGEGKVATLLASVELGRRFIMEESAVEKRAILTHRCVYELMLPLLKGLKHEEFWILLLNERNYLIRKIKTTSGGGNSTVIDVRQVLRYALELCASSIILVHNHPSGNPHPSLADSNQTKLMHDAANACNIQLMDHVIVSDDSFFSFEDRKVYQGIRRPKPKDMREE